jgi:predicted NUDIX family NTP pyrophosphohydrolase
VLRQSAGLLLYRPGIDGTEVLLVHPGGPLWRRKDVGAWQIPKGEIEPGEDEQAAARREVAEELGVEVTAALLPLGEVRQAGGKRVVAFAAVSDFDPDTLVSNVVEIEWPPRSGRRLAIPEIDAACWMSIDDARTMMLASQSPFLDRLEAALGSIILASNRSLLTTQS